MEITFNSLKSILYDSKSPEDLEDSPKFLGIPWTHPNRLDRSFEIVHSSNMSKVCENMEIANQTVEWYKQMKLDIKLYASAIIQQISTRNKHW